MLELEAKLSCIRRGSKWRDGGWGMSSGHSVESFVGLATGRRQSSCQVGNGKREREREGFRRVCLQNLNSIPITILEEIQGN